MAAKCHVRLQTAGMLPCRNRRWREAPSMGIAALNAILQEPACQPLLHMSGVGTIKRHVHNPVGAGHAREMRRQPKDRGHAALPKSAVARSAIDGFHEAHPCTSPCGQLKLCKTASYKSVETPQFRRSGPSTPAHRSRAWPAPTIYAFRRGRRASLMRRRPRPRGRSAPAVRRRCPTTWPARAAVRWPSPAAVRRGSRRHGRRRSSSSGRCRS